MAGNRMPEASRSVSSAVRHLERLQRELFPAAGLTLVSGMGPDSATREKFAAAAAQALGIDAAQIENALADGLEKETANCSTRYEDPYLFSLMSDLFEELEKSAGMQNIALPARPAFGTLPLRQFNAMAISVPDTKEYVIAFQVGVFGFMNLACKAFAAALPGTTEEGGGLRFSTDLELVREHLSNDPEPTLRMADFLEAYVYEGDPHAAEQYFLPNPGAALVSILRKAAELFVLGHEYGHLIAGHLTADREAPDDATPVDPDDLPPAWKDEFEADFLGLVLSTQTMVSEGFDLPLAYAGVDIAFTAMDLVERALAVAKHGRAAIQGTTDTHPPPVLRRAMMRHGLGQITDEGEQVQGARELANALELVGLLFWEKIEPQLQQRHDAGARPSLIWR
jgi:hypothetical protein